MSTCLYLFLIFLVTFIAGAFGGYINYCMLNTSEARKTKQGFKSIVLGIGAAFIVPLFLETIQSQLLDNSKKDTMQLFVYAGFCLIAAIYSKRFLETISERVLRKADDALETAAEAKKTANENNKILDAIIEDEDEVPPPPADEGSGLEAAKGRISSTPAPVREVTPEAIYAVFKQSPYNFRLVYGLARDLNAPVDKVAATLEQMDKEQLVRHFVKDNGKVIWSLTAKGWKQLGMA